VQRVAIVGPGGVGKSTFARELGRRTGLPVIHLDRHFWKPGWVETSREEWAARQADLLAADAWIADGNYGGTLKVRFLRADTVVVLTLPRGRCIIRALRRTLGNRGQAVQAEGCPERIDAEFLRWIWNYPTNSRPRLDAAIAAHPHLRVVDLASTAAARAFLDSARPTDT